MGVDIRHTSASFLEPRMHKEPSERDITSVRFDRVLHHPTLRESVSGLAPRTGGWVIRSNNKMSRWACDLHYCPLGMCGVS